MTGWQSTRLNLTGLNSLGFRLELEKIKKKSKESKRVRIGARVKVRIRVMFRVVPWLG